MYFGPPPPHSVDRIGDFCNPFPVQYFHCVIQSDPIPVVPSNILSDSGLYPKKTLIEHLNAVINEVCISTSEPVKFFRNLVQTGSSSELQNPVGSQSGNRIMFNTATWMVIAVLPTLRFSREFGLVFFWICGFFWRVAGCLFLGLFCLKIAYFWACFFANFLISGLLFWNCCVTFAVSISWKSIVYCLASK